MCARSSTERGSDRFYERFQRWRGMLRDGGAAELIVELKQLRDTADRGKQRASIQGEINYFETNRGRMNYRQYREQHLPIGSGTVESACKNVVAARMKQSGMVRQANWHMARGESPWGRRRNQSTSHREPCVGSRKGAGEASAAERAGGLLSAAICFVWSAETVMPVEGNTGRGRHGETRPGSTASENSGTHASHIPGPGRPSGRPGGSSPGPRREGVKPDQG